MEKCVKSKEPNPLLSLAPSGSVCALSALSRREKRHGRVRVLEQKFKETSGAVDAEAKTKKEKKCASALTTKKKKMALATTSHSAFPSLALFFSFSLPFSLVPQPPRKPHHAHCSLPLRAAQRRAGQRRGRGRHQGRQGERERQEKRERRRKTIEEMEPSTTMMAVFIPRVRAFRAARGALLSRSFSCSDKGTSLLCMLEWSNDPITGFRGQGGRREDSNALFFVDGRQTKFQCLVFFSLRDPKAFFFFLFSCGLFSPVTSSGAQQDIAFDARERGTGDEREREKRRREERIPSTSSSFFYFFFFPFFSTSTSTSPTLLSLYLPSKKRHSTNQPPPSTQGPDRLRHRRHQVGPRAPPGEGEEGHQGRPRGQARRHARHRRRRLRQAGRRRVAADDVPDAQAQDPGVDGRGAEDAEHPGGGAAEGEAVEGGGRKEEEKERKRRRKKGGGGGGGSTRVFFSLFSLPLLLAGSLLPFYFRKQSQPLSMAPVLVVVAAVFCGKE